MKAIFLRKFLKRPTPFFIVGLIGIIYSLPMMIYSFQLSGGASLGALNFIALLFLSIISIVIDLVISNCFNYIIVLVLEVTLSLAFYVYWKYQNRQNIIDLRQMKHSYLIIIDNPRGFKLTNFKRSGLFDKMYVSKDTDVLEIDESSIDYNSIRFLSSNQGDGVIEKDFHTPEYNLEWSFIQLPTTRKNYSDTQMDSIFRTKFPKIQLHNPDFKGY